DRPELRRPGAVLRLPARRQLRRRSGARGVRAGAGGGDRDARRSARVGGVAARAGRRRDRGREHARARAAHPRGRRAALCRRRRADRRAARTRARTAADRRPAARPQRRRDRARLPRCRPARRARRPRLQALDPAAARGRRRRGRGRARRLGCGRDPRALAARGTRRQRPRRPVGAAGSDRHGARAARPRPALRYLSRPPAARPCTRLRDVQAAVRPPRCEPSGARSARTRARDRPEPRLRRRRRRAREPRLAERRHVRRARGRRLRERAVPSRGGARPPRRAPVLRPGGCGMPKRADLRSVLIVGSGPIRIGQGCEFDYSASQACRVLRREGLRVVLVNSNPATIMTDPDWADATYLEPLDAETLEQIVEAERPDGLLPTLGGQTALNLAVELHERGCDIELLGASIDAIRRAEDRLLFREAVVAAGLQVPHSVVVTGGDPVPDLVPAIVRPAFTLGGLGGGIARTRGQLERLVAHGIAASPVGQVLVEESLEGWQEFELEVMCDAAGNCVVVCSIENLDPMGVHTGDSWTVAPQQTLPDAEYQRLREAAFACARAVGVATGGANVQFAYEPGTRELRVIEMNPRVSRSSALASKATGFP